MKIASSNIQFYTEYSQRDRERNNAFISANVQTTPDTPNASLTRTVRALETEERVSLNSNQSTHTYSTSSVKSKGEDAAQQHINQKAVSSLLSRFYSQNVRMLDIQTSAQPSTPQNTQRSTTLNNEADQFTLSAGAYYEFQSSQSLSFVARGEIKTEDGRAISFEFFAQANQNFEYRKGSGVYAAQVAQNTDPLVINLAGDYNNLSSSAFEFDLNSDGETEHISFAGRGSGFLVLDKNGDGKINNGQELFGPSTGNGFNELADYDEDGNGFIDAGDAAFEKLQVWVKDEEGNDKLLSLKEADVAAIGVESGYSPFDVKDDYNHEYGQVQSTGIFVRESGEVGSVQQINLTHRDIEAEKSLKDEFDQGELQNQSSQQDRTSQSPRAITIPNFDVKSLENVMQRLDSVTQAMLERQDQLAEMNNGENGPKSLIQQIVEKLEEVRLEQEEKQAEEQKEDAHRQQT